MKAGCKDYAEGLATLAEGEAASEAAEHVAGCADCAARLQALRRIIDAARVPQWDAPAALVARATALMPPQAIPRRLIARLLGSSLSAAGARAAEATDFALHLGAEELSIRVHYSPAPGGYELLGRAPAGTWAVLRGAAEDPCGPGGRFRLLVPSLDDTAFVLRSLTDGQEVEVPSASELIHRAP